MTLSTTLFGATVLFRVASSDLKRAQSVPVLSTRGLILLLVFLASVIPSGFASEMEFKSCEIGNPTSGLLARAECAEFEVAEDPNSPDGKRISLKVARIAARSRSSLSDPFTLLAGGPGQSALESWPSVQGAFERIRKDRDIYLVDQRGTGQSNRLECPDPPESVDPFNFDAESIRESSANCLASLPSDPRFYTTSIAVQDLDKIRAALGIEQWNVYGISYGTRVGLHYLRRFPERVRTLTLDAVVPPSLVLGGGIAIEAERAFELMLDRCRSDADCSGRYPDLGSRTRALISQLRNKPQQISFENFNSGKVESLEFSLGHLTLSMRMLAYSSHGASILPNMLFEAYENGNFAPFARQASMQAGKVGSTLASGMHNAVICTEDFPFIDFDNMDRKQLESTYLGTDAIDAIRANCQNWPAGIIDSDFKEPVESDVPVLILSGDADPVTPPAYAESITEGLPNSLHIVNPAQGHMQVALGCMPMVLANFIERGTTSDVDFACLERLSPEPFFIDANGPMP